MTKKIEEIRLTQEANWDFQTQFVEARKPFLQKQLELCMDASRSAARLATTRDNKKWNESLERFLELYWGELAIVEKKREMSERSIFDAREKKRLIEVSMVEFKEVLDKILSNISNHKQLGLPYAKLEGPALKISHSCSAEIKKGWDVSSVGVGKISQEPASFWNRIFSFFNPEKG